MIKVNYDGNIYEIQSGIKVIDFIRKNLSIDEDQIIACKIFNKVKSLNHKLDKDCDLTLLDMTTADGNRIYVRGLTFIMLKAFEDLYPNLKIVVNYSLGYSLFSESYDKSSKITKEMINKVSKRMKEIVESDFPFIKNEISLEEAKELYSKYNMDDKLGLLENRLKPYVSVYSCDGTYNYFYGKMPISTKYMKYFKLQKYNDGVLLIYPRRSEPTVVRELHETKKLYNTFEEYDNIYHVLDVGNVSDINNWIKSGKAGDLIRISEALHEKKIAQIADMIASDKKKRIVLIAGPSSSGKTTFSQRLAIQLRVNGIKSIAISMDNYFRNREDNPKDENGNYDFECLEAVDTELFNKDLASLLNGEEVELPKFDFITGHRVYDGNIVKLNDDEIIIIEGIHGLNEELTKKIPRDKKFKIYISALTSLNIDNCNRVSTSDSRLIRRIVRDSKFRSHGAAASIKMWPSVRSGEEKYIFPYQEDADAMFNSSLIYESAALKSFAEPLLAGIDETKPEFSEAKRIFEFLRYFLPIPVDEIPINSILREFIGGGCFYR